MRDQRTLSGWGRTAPTMARVERPVSDEQLQEAISGAGERGVLARGLGRSYGDAAQNAGGLVLDLTDRDRVLHDDGAGTLRVESGVSLDTLMRRFVPAGWFVPVTPGTRQVTVGGAIGSDIHGKNHHVKGTFGQHIRSMDLLLASGEIRTVTPDDALFCATVGGMARSVLTRGRFARADELSDKQAHEPLDYRPRVLLTAPSFVPGGLLNKFSVAAFNEVWFRKAPAHRVGELQSITTFFHPLDGVADWNRIYGAGGLIQYQIVVPDGHEDTIRTCIEAFSSAGAASFLAVLKRFGPHNPGPLSFPMSGWTLALDVPATMPDLGPLLDRLDALVIAVGGRGYLAKDSRMTPETFRAMYPRYPQWAAVRDAVDPEHLFISDLARRLAL